MDIIYFYLNGKLPKKKNSLFNLNINISIGVKLYDLHTPKHLHKRIFEGKR